MLLHILMKIRWGHPSYTYLSFHLELHTSTREIDGILCKVFNHLRATYVAEDIISKADMDSMNFKQPFGPSEVENTQAL